MQYILSNDIRAILQGKYGFSGLTSIEPLGRQYLSDYLEGTCSVVGRVKHNIGSVILGDDH